MMDTIHRAITQACARICAFFDGYRFLWDDDDDSAAAEDRRVPVRRENTRRQQLRPPGGLCCTQKLQRFQSRFDAIIDSRRELPSQGVDVGSASGSEDAAPDGQLEPPVPAEAAATMRPGLVQATPQARSMRPPPLL